MLWYKSWLETRWRFLIGLGVLLCSAVATVYTYPQVLRLLPLVSPQGHGALSAEIRQSIELSRHYRGFIWLQWFRQNSIDWTTVFAILLGTSGVVSNSRETGFTLSLPLSRTRVAGVRGAAGLGELFALVFLPSIVVPLLSPAIGQTYSMADTLIHGACLFVGATVFFSAAFLFSHVFDDVWRPLLLAFALVVAFAVLDKALHAPAIFSVMSGETFFRTGRLPWPGLLACVAASGAMGWITLRIFMHRDL